MDLGTTNTGLARWDAAHDRPRLLDLPEICRLPGGDDHLQAPRLIPSATEPLAQPDFWARMSSRPLLSRLALWGRLAWIGREAVARNDTEARPAFAPTFKPYLGLDAMKIIARAGGQSFTARDIAHLFMREALWHARQSTGERIRDLVITTPVDAYESYRAELLRIGRRLGVRRLRFIDEPVAAAIGYDLAYKAERLVLVADFGGGTLDLALVRLTPRDVEAGTCRVLAKAGREIGGNLVDRWLLEHFCEALDYPLREDSPDEARAFWHRVMLAEARRVKEAVYFKRNDDETEPFTLTPPEEMRAFEARLRGDAESLEVSRKMVTGILEGRGLYRALEGCIDGVLEQARRDDIAPDQIDDVLMVGGSTLLPGVYPIFERRFGRDRVRGWKPFEAVAYGAAAYAAGRFAQSDFIVHDYAFVTYDPQTHKPQHTVIIPRGTRVPTPPDVWQRKLVPTCSLGEPERIFKLVICEVGVHDSERRFGWDAAGNLHTLGGDAEGGPGDPMVVPLNESNPTLGRLDPPHAPGDKRPRLEISFAVNAERWLVATVRDLKTRKLLMREEPVVRLL